MNFSVSGPINEQLGFVVSAAYNDWDGNIRNLFNGKRVNGRETLNLRGKIRWEPTDTAALTILGQLRQRQTPRSVVPSWPSAPMPGCAGTAGLPLRSCSRCRGQPDQPEYQQQLRLAYPL